MQPSNNSSNNISNSSQIFILLQGRNFQGGKNEMNWENSKITWHDNQMQPGNHLGIEIYFTTKEWLEFLDTFQLMYNSKQMKAQLAELWL